MLPVLQLQVVHNLKSMEFNCYKNHVSG